MNSLREAIEEIIDKWDGYEPNEPTDSIIEMIKSLLPKSSGFPDCGHDSGECTCSGYESYRNEVLKLLK